jgi:hypothetical protein
MKICPKLKDQNLSENFSAEIKFHEIDPRSMHIKGQEEVWIGIQVSVRAELGILGTHSQ